MEPMILLLLVPLLHPPPSLPSPSTLECRRPCRSPTSATQRPASAHCHLLFFPHRPIRTRGRSSRGPLVAHHSQCPPSTNATARRTSSRRRHSSRPAPATRQPPSAHRRPAPATPTSISPPICSATRANSTFLSSLY
ncbi:hypothetical protein I3760_09G182600 [Carya illinoinensis]|nr:hypothetical protein I3760_09G182600 [Carya illinoinensis]